MFHEDVLKEFLLDKKLSETSKGTSHIDQYL